MIQSVAPEYPEHLRNNRVQGNVVVEVTIDLTGKVTETRILRSSGSKDLDRAAEEAARQWVFTPARHYGEPVTSKIGVPFDFRIHGP